MEKSVFNQTKLIKDYLKFCLDIKLMARNYAREDNITLSKAMDKVSNDINKYAI